MNETTQNPTTSEPVLVQHVDVLQTLASHFWVVELRGTSLATSKTYKRGAHTLAADTGGSETAFRSMLKLFPRGFDAELSELRKAFSAVRRHFNESTQPFSSGLSENSDGSVRTQGPRLLASRDHYDSTFMSAHAALMQELQAAKQRFVTEYPFLLQRIESARALGSAFDPSLYPTLEQVRASWNYELIGPAPLADASNLQNRAIPLSASAAHALEARMQRQARAQLDIALQALAHSSLKAVEKLAERLEALRAYQDTPESERGRKPPLFASVLSNITHQVELLRAYAVPGTDIGSQFERLATEIETKLQPKAHKPAAIADSAELVRDLAVSTAEISKSFDELEILY